MRLDQIKEPEDEGVLDAMMPKLERLKSSIDAIVDCHLDSILGPKFRAKIAYFVWAEMVK
jgi:hypothetical protein